VLSTNRASAAQGLAGAMAQRSKDRNKGRFAATVFAEDYCPLAQANGAFGEGFVERAYSKEFEDFRNHLHALLQTELPVKDLYSRMFRFRPVSKEMSASVRRSVFVGFPVDGNSPLHSSNPSDCSS
jgi:hypothetical protein